MKEIKIYSLEGCNNCKAVTSEINKLIAGTEINLVKKFCGSNDSACDALEDGLGTSIYPIVYMSNMDYFKDKFNVTAGIVYICNNYNEVNAANSFSADTVSVGVLNISSMIEFLNKIVK